MTTDDGTCCRDYDHDCGNVAVSREPCPDCGEPTQRWYAYADPSRYIDWCEACLEKKGAAIKGGQDRSAAEVCRAGEIGAWCIVAALLLVFALILAAWWGWL